MKKFERPRILLLDLDVECSDSLTEMGFNVDVGSLGRPYRVQRSSDFSPVMFHAEVPNPNEQEVIIIDLALGPLLDYPEGEKYRPDEESDLWAKCDKGFIDPRVITAVQLQKSFDRIHNAGGFFVIFADRKTGIELQVARLNRVGNLIHEESFDKDVWGVLSEVSDIRVKFDEGSEIKVVAANAEIARLMERYSGGSTFTCVLESGYRDEDKWEILLVSKYDDAVGLMRCRGTKGGVIVLPQIQDKKGILNELFSEILPSLAPHLFPDLQKGLWTSLPEYELEKVLALQKQKNEVEQRARDEITVLDEELAKERATNGWIHDLLTGTDDVLVAAVKMALSSVGFVKVVDIDEERDREGKSRREDLQIQDGSPTLILDVKGIGGHPSDADVLQADKHAAIRMREEKRTDIVGLSIINHQRHLPPLDRDNTMPFRQELLDAAEERSLGLLTSWDLYRLVVNTSRLSWAPENLMPLFYERGEDSCEAQAL